MRWIAPSAIAARGMLPKVWIIDPAMIGNTQASVRAALKMKAAVRPVSAAREFVETAEARMKTG
jgi:hypothetical protein